MTRMCERCGLRPGVVLAQAWDDQGEETGRMWLCHACSDDLRRVLDA